MTLFSFKDKHAKLFHTDIFVYLCSQDVYKQILNALIEWRGRDYNDNSAKDKIELLFEVLLEDGVERRDLVESLAENYSLPDGIDIP